MTKPTDNADRLRFVTFGTYQSGSHPRIRVLIEGLRELGHEVVEINEPLGLSTAARVSMLKAPWKLPLLLCRLASRWGRLIRRGLRLRRTTPAIDAVLVGYLGHFDVHLARLVFPDTPVALDHLIFAAGTAKDRGQESRVISAALQLVDRRAMAAATVIIVDTPEHQQRVPAELADRTVVCPVGADSSWFQAAARQHRVAASATPLRVVFFGLFTPLQGTAIIGEALSLVSDEPIQATMIGTGQDLAEARRAADAAIDTDWVDWVPTQELPDVVASHDVALGIFGTTVKAAEVVPNKVFQSAAAGCALITSDTMPQRRTLGDAAELIPAGSATALADAMRRLAVDPELLNRRRAQARELAETTFSPAAVSTPLLEKLLPAITRRH